MAFVKKSTSSVVSTQKVDSSQIGKLQEAGFQVTPVATDTSVLANTLPTTKQVLPGVVLSGNVDAAGNFLITDQFNVVHDVKVKPSVGSAAGGDVGLSAPTGGDLLPSNPFIQDFARPNGGMPGGPAVGGGGSNVPPPVNLGSGRIYTRFDVGDIVPNQQETVTRALWSNNVGNLLTFYTSSTQNSTSKRYYYEIYNSASGECGSEPQFSVAYGHKQGSGSADEGGQINDTPSRAIYGQYKQLCLEPGDERFVIGGNATDQIYVVNVNRARMREFIDEGNIELNLQRLSGSQWLAGGGAQNAWTGSNVRVFPTQAVTRLIDDSRITTADVTSAGEVYNIVSGTIEDGVYNSSAPHYYGKLYKKLGIVVLDGNKLDQSCSFLSVTGSEIPGDNAYKLFVSISGSARYTDTSGDYLGFAGRSGEKVKSSHYFVRVKNQEYNFSNNPTFITGSEGDLAEPTMIGDPTVYITSVGLYNDAKELLAVGKLNKPLKKNFSLESLVKVRLDF
jgi:hypothetical protein